MIGEASPCPRATHLTLYKHHMTRGHIRHSHMHMSCIVHQLLVGQMTSSPTHITGVSSSYAHAGHFTQLVWADSTKVGCGIGYASRKFDRWVGGCKVRQPAGGGVWDEETRHICPSSPWAASDAAISSTNAANASLTAVHLRHWMPAEVDTAQLCPWCHASQCPMLLSRHRADCVLPLLTAWQHRKRRLVRQER